MKLAKYIIAISLVTTFAISAFASGKMLRPPKVDPCKVDPNAEGCTNKGEQ